MRLFMKGVLAALALAIPCFLAWSPPASAITFPDARATVDRACSINYSRSKNVAIGPFACIHPATGVYKVAFKWPVDKCTITGTLGVASLDFLSPDPGEISLGWSPPFKNVVLVRTFNSGGYPYDNGFRLNVECD